MTACHLVERIMTFNKTEHSYWCSNNNKQNVPVNFRSKHETIHLEIKTWHIQLQSMADLLITQFLNLSELRRDIYLKDPSMIKSVIQMTASPSFMCSSPAQHAEFLI
jgi:hypothetical protein